MNTSNEKTQTQKKQPESIFLKVTCKICKKIVGYVEAFNHDRSTEYFKLQDVYCETCRNNRKLIEEENKAQVVTIHHINGDKTDNRLENLQALTKEESEK